MATRREDTDPFGSFAVTTSAGADIDVRGKAYVTYSVKSVDSSPQIKAYAAGTSGTYYPVPYQLLTAAGARSSVAGDTASGALSVGDKVIVPNPGLLSIRIIATTGSLTCDAVTNLPGGLDAVLLSSSSGGDASAANQATQITAEQAIQAAVQIMDDWDESDRAKVNPIVGQAGVAAGAGAVSATVQRVTLASDDPLVANMGYKGGFSVQLTPTVATATYIAGDVIGGILTFASVNGASGRPIKIQSIALVDKSQQSVPFTILFFKATPSGGTYTDGSPLVFGSGDYANFVGAVRFFETEWVSYPATPTDDFANKNDLNMIVPISATSLFALIVSDDSTTITLTNGDLIVTVSGEQL